MKRQNSASFVSRSFFLSSDFSVSRLFPLPDALQAYGRQGQGFRAEYAPQEEDSARNGFAA
jgi:hypothetical protein